MSRPAGVIFTGRLTRTRCCANLRERVKPCRTSQSRCIAAQDQSAAMRSGKRLRWQKRDDTEGQMTENPPLSRL
jgi:hypothetical protein